MERIAVRSVLVLLGGLLLVGPAFSQGSPPFQFQGLGALPGTTEGSLGADISADGSLVVGGSPSSATFQEAWRWTSAGGMQGLGFLPGETTSKASVVTADGQFIAGSSGSDAFRWSSGGGFEAIDDGMIETNVSGISDDGGTVVGTGTDYPYLSDEFSAWRWRSGAGIDLAIPGHGFSGGWTGFHDVSADGQTILASFSFFDIQNPYLLTDSGSTYLSVGFGVFHCQCGNSPNAMNPDASVVVGAFQWTEAFRWNVAGGDGQLLGFLDFNGSFDSSDALAVSSNGSIVVGESSDENEQRAFIWDSFKDMRGIRQILVHNGIDLTGWQLTSAKALSADGTVILGNGINPSGVPEAWLAVIPATPKREGVPTLGGTGYALLAALLMVGGAYALQNRLRPSAGGRTGL